MLGKLLKYEIPAMGRKLLPLYAAWAATALILGLTMDVTGANSELMRTITGLFYVGIGMTIFVITIILIVQRYSNSLLGDEGYFNHVLPVSVSEHIGNKLISATSWVAVTVLVALLTAFLTAIGSVIAHGGIDLHGLDLQTLGIPKHFGLYVIQALILGIAGIVKTIMQIYAAITIGHQADNRTTLVSLGAYIGFVIFESLVGRVLMPFMEKFAGFSGGGVLVLTVLAVLLSALYFFICKYLMENRLNLA